MTEVSYNQLAELTGKQYRTLKKRLEKAGVYALHRAAGPGGAHIFDSSEALAAIYAAEFHHGGIVGDNETLDLQQERARLAREQREMVALKRAERTGKLLPVADVNKAWTDHIINAKTKIMGIPSKVAPIAADLDDPRKIQAEVKKLTDEILNDLADSVGSDEKRTKKKMKRKKAK